MRVSADVSRHPKRLPLLRRLHATDVAGQAHTEDVAQTGYQVVERELDRLLVSTKTRPLPNARLHHS